MFRKVFLFSFLLLLRSNPTFSELMDFDAYRMLDLGNSESDVVNRAGPPDKTIRFCGRDEYDGDDIKQFFYVPSSHAFDPHLTIVTFLNRKIIKLEREQSTVPSVNATPGQMPYDIYTSLKKGMSVGELLTRAGLPDREYQPEPEKDVKCKTVLVSEFVYEPAQEDVDPQLTYIYITRGKISKILRGTPIKTP